MNVHKGIFLVGLASSGKSTLGKELAQKLGYKFIDLDHLIEQREAKSIPDIFTHNGEGQFRIWEHEALMEVVAAEDTFVMATGGGAPCFHFNMDTMNRHGITVFFDVTPGELAIRLMDAGLEHRPMFKSYDHQDLIQEIREMKEKREVFYNQAQIKIRDNQITTDLIISNLKAKDLLH